MPGNHRNRPPRGRNFNSHHQGHTVQPFASNDNRASLASQGPLMTNHLQLDELDLELALLKRKREMIEKQHTMLVGDSRYGGSSSQYGFNQASQSYGQRSEPTRNFSNFYNDPAEPQYSRFNPQQGVKRPAIDPWDNSSPKRFNPSSGYKKPSARYEPRQPARSEPASQPPPLMSSSFRQRRPPPSATRTNFKPTKVTKPRQNTAPNKLKSYPVEERKSLVAKATTGLAPPKLVETIFYEPDKPPNPKLQGRLALALGNIVREMRDQCSATDTHISTFTNMSSLRALKYSIRERIRVLTVGTHVGSAVDVVGLYRKKHPKETDIELLDNARENMAPNGNLAIEIIKQGNPERYFRTNFRRLLDASLTEMFEKVQLLYTKVRDGRSIQEVIDGILVDLDKPLKDVKVEIEDDEEICGDNEDAEAEQSVKIEKCAEDGENATKSKETATKSDETTINSEETTAPAEENAAKSEESGKPEEKADEPKQNGDKPTDSGDAKVTDKVPKNDGAQPAGSRPEIVRAKFYSRLMDTLIRRNLPSVIPKYREYILKILNTSEAFKETKAYLIKTTNEKVDADNKAAATPAASKDNKQFFVRIVGRPQLPKKKMMKTFLDTFHPTLIKKHRNMHNILFVSFDNEENFNNILAQNGETVGNSICRLDIRPSEKVNKNNNEPQAKKTAQQDAKTNDTDVETAEPKSDDVQLDQSLDTQITDLLSSIREEEELKVDEPEKPGNVVVKDEGKKEAVQDDVKDEGEEEAVNEGGEEEAVNEGGEEEAVNEGGEDEAVNEGGEEAINDDQQQDEENADNTEPEAVQKNVEAAKKDSPAKGTPTRSSIRTRRASKLAN